MRASAMVTLLKTCNFGIQNGRQSAILDTIITNVELVLLYYTDTHVQFMYSTDAYAVLYIFQVFM